ncbi:hypothetical protein ACI8AK_05330 [Geodermatophilus sp. SYSU D00867]
MRYRVRIIFYRAQPAGSHAAAIAPEEWLDMALAGFAGLLALIKAVGTYAGAVTSLYGFANTVREFFAGPNDPARDKVLATYNAVIQSRKIILEASSDILDALKELDKTIFRSTLADKLGDADQAVQALDNWRRSGSEVMKGVCT